MGTHGRPPIHRARVYFALVACLLWLAGVEAGPALHLAMHDRLGPHRHEGAAIVLLDAPTLADDPQFRALLAQLDTGAGDAESPPPPHRRAVDDAHARLAAQLAHGHGALAHHDQATRAPAIPLHAPLPIDRTPTRVAYAVTVTPISATVPEAAARGPPA